MTLANPFDNLFMGGYLQEQFQLVLEAHLGSSTYDEAKP